MLNNPVTTNGLLPYSGLSYLTYGLWIEAEAGVELEGIISAQSALTGTVNRTTSLNSIISGQSELIATLRKYKDVSGILDARSSLIGTLGRTRKFLPIKKYLSTILIDELLSDIITSGLQYIKEHNEIIDMLFNNLQQHDLQLLKDVFTNTSIAVNTGYSKSGIKIPSIIILNSTEDEFYPSLGKFLGKGYNPYRVDYTVGPPHGTTGSNIMSDFFYGTDTLNTEYTRVGKGGIKKFTPDDGIKERYGSTFNSNFNIHILTDDPLLTVFLYQLVKYFIYDEMMTFEKNGVIDLIISGTDLSPMIMTTPDVAYSRILMLQMTSSMDIIYKHSTKLKLGVNMDVRNMEYEIISTLNLINATEPVIVNITPNNITVGVETDITVSCTNIDKDATVEFLDLPFSELISGNSTGINEISRFFVGDNNIMLRVIGYTEGTTRIKFTNPNGDYFIWREFSVTT